MKVQTELKGFFKHFFAKINAYRDVKQGYDDLGSAYPLNYDGETSPVRFTEG